MLGACEGETPGTTDCIRLPDGVYDGSDCPIGAALAAGDRVEWWSSGYWQGSVGSYDNECASKGNCGYHGAPPTSVVVGRSVSYDEYCWLAVG
jgi:hypothetical protein